MNLTEKLQQHLHEQQADETLIDLIPSLELLLPEGVTFEMDTWNLIYWQMRKGRARTLNLNFEKFKNKDLMILTKIYFLEKRLTKNIDPKSLIIIIQAIRQLDNALGMQNISKISNAIFLKAKELITTQSYKSTRYRYIDFLVAFGNWLSINMGYRISFENNLEKYYDHGRKSSDNQRHEKLIDSRIILDLISANQRDNLSLKDQFYLSAFAILVGTGFRISELSTLPKDCIIKEGNNVGIRFFPVKKPQLDIRWLESNWVPVIEDAINKIIKLTNPARDIAMGLYKKPGLDWSSIIKDKEAAQYFVGKFCHQWTCNPQHNMFNKNGAWFEKNKEYIDITSLINEKGSKSQCAKHLKIGRSTVDALLSAQQLANHNTLPLKAKGRGKNKRTSWDTDSRVISLLQFEKHIGIAINYNLRNNFSHIFEDARINYQLQGKIYPAPTFNKALEKKYERIIRPVIEDKSGKPVLKPEEALFVTLKYQLSDARETKTDDYTLITIRAFSAWFCGEKRSKGSKNLEDSCFSRLNIIDPKTGKIAKFTSHDIRHWLTTYYLEGGMPSDQVALLFNRAPDQNDTYDQISSKTRLNNMRQAIRDGGAIGHIADAYNAISEYSRSEAEQYLKASTLQLNIMPHGSCSLPWGMDSCPNHNACFNCKSGICKHLCINPTDEETKLELKRMHQETEIALQVIPKQSPQYSHYQNIQKNLNSLDGDHNNG